MDLALTSTTTMAPRSERTLVALARAGDNRAFEQLYARYRERVTAFIHGKVRDHGRAEDISQEVFMAALRQLRSHDQPIAFKPWIFAIAKNACIDEFRRSARGREVPVDTDENFPTNQRASLSIVPSPPAAIESKQRIEDLRGAFGGLSESHHRLLVMRELEGRSYDEIGHRLGMTRPMVQSGLFRARRRISEEYDALASGRRCDQAQAVIDSGTALTPKALGIKERRRLTQHLSHCQGCRQYARMAGIDEALLKPRSIPAKIAAFLPFGAVWRRLGQRGRSAPARAHASGHLTASGAGPAAGAAGSSVTLGQAAAAVAALAVAGAGGGVAIAQHAHQGHRTATAHHVSTRGTGGAAAGAGTAARATSGAAGKGTGTSRSASHGFSARPSATGSKPGPTAVGPGTKRPGTNSPVPGQNPSTGGAGSRTSSTGAPSSTSSPGGSPTRLLNTTIQHPGQTLGKVAAPVKKTIDPVTAPVKSVVAAPVTAVSAPVKSVTDPVTTPVKSVVTAPVKAVSAPVKSVVSAPVTTATNPVTSATPVKEGGSAVGATVQKVLPQPTATSPSSATGTSSGSGSSQSPVPGVTKVLAGP